LDHMDINLQKKIHGANIISGESSWYLKKSMISFPPK
jgi:hypothetical protein